MSQSQENFYVAGVAPRSWRRPPICLYARQKHLSTGGRGVGGLRCHAEWPQVADAVLAALRSSLRLSASHDHACTRTNDKACIP